MSLLILLGNRPNQSWFCHANQVTSALLGYYRSLGASVGPFSFVLTASEGITQSSSATYLQSCQDVVLCRRFVKISYCKILLWPLTDYLRVFLKDFLNNLLQDSTFMGASGHEHDADVSTIGPINDWCTVELTWSSVLRSSYFSFCARRRISASCLFANWRGLFRL